MGYVWNLKLHQGKANHIICFLLELLKKWGYTVLARSCLNKKILRLFMFFSGITDDRHLIFGVHPQLMLPIPHLYNTYLPFADLFFKNYLSI